MTNKKKVQESRADMIDKIFAQVDPLVAAAGILCAASTSLGIPPPLTSILNTIYNKEMMSDITDALTWSPVSSVLGMAMGKGAATSWADIITGNYGQVKESEADKARRHHGMILVGAFEGMVIMSLVRNETALNKMMELGGKIGAATITAAGEAVPF